MWIWFLIYFYLTGVFFLEVPLPDEVESYLVLQECLEMRKRYVFREDIAPWEKEIISDPSTPKPNPDPFQYTSEGKSDVSLSLSTNDSSILCCMLLILLQMPFVLIVLILFYCSSFSFYAFPFCSIILKCKMGSFTSMQTKIVRTWEFDSWKIYRCMNFWRIISIALLMCTIWIICSKGRTFSCCWCNHLFYWSSSHT